MQFFPWVTDYDNFRSQKGKRNCPSNLEFTVKRAHELEESKVVPFRLLLESNWIDDGRPYYRIHPGLVSNLSRVNLTKIPANLVVVPEPFEAVHISLAQNHKELTLVEDVAHEPNVTHKGTLPAGSVVRGIMMGKIAPVHRRVLFCLDFGHYNENHQPTYVVFMVSLDDKGDLQSAVDGTLQTYRSDDYRMVCANALRLAVTIGFMSNSKSELIEPDVLSKLRDSYRQGGEAQRQNIVRKSRRRGKVGFNVGNDLMFLGEMSKGSSSGSTETGRELQWQHIRGGHFHAVRYGEQRKLVKIMWFQPTQVRPDKSFKPESADTSQ
jgi:hypothetical protein